MSANRILRTIGYVADRMTSLLGGQSSSVTRQHAGKPTTARQRPRRSLIAAFRRKCDPERGIVWSIHGEPSKVAETLILISQQEVGR